MSLIICSDDCIYQKNGYCMLEGITTSSNKSFQKSCIHYIKTKKYH